MPTQLTGAVGAIAREVPARSIQPRVITAAIRESVTNDKQRRRLSRRGVAAIVRVSPPTRGIKVLHAWGTCPRECSCIVAPFVTGDGRETVRETRKNRETEENLIGKESPPRKTRNVEAWEKQDEGRHEGFSSNIVGRIGKDARGAAGRRVRYMDRWASGRWSCGSLFRRRNHQFRLMNSGAHFENERGATGGKVGR